MKQSFIGVFIMDLANLTKNQKIIMNTCLVAGITMFSVFATNAPNLNILYSGFVAGFLAGLIQLRKDVDNNPVMLSIL